MTPIGLGIIGAGKHGQRYLRHAHEDVAGVRVVALARQDRAAGEAQARERGCRFHGDWRDLVADPEVEAVVAVVPPTLHAPIARAVAAARKALLVEKPLAPTGREAVEIVRTLREAGVPALVAHTLRWNAVAATIRDHLPALGPLRALVLNQRFEPSPLGWLDDPSVSGGGMLIHTGVHSFDLVRWLTGREIVRVRCRTFRAVTRRTEDNFAAMLDLDGPPVAVLVNGSRATQGRSGLIDVAGAEGQLVGDHSHGIAHRIHALDRTPLDVGPPVHTVCAVLEDFVALVRQGAAPRISLEDGARAVQVAEACRVSADTDVPVAVPPLVV